MSWLNIFKHSKAYWMPPANIVGLSSMQEGLDSPNLPDQFQAIAIYPQNGNWREGFLEMSCDVINQLSRKYYTVTHTLEFISDQPKKKYYDYKPPATYALNYHRFLLVFGVAHAISDDSSQLIVQTEPESTTMTALLRDEDIHTTNFKIYAYTSPIDITTFSETLPLVSNTHYIFQFEFDLYSCGLSIIFDTRIISIDDLKRIIAGVCVRYGKELDSDL